MFSGLGNNSTPMGMKRQKRPLKKKGEGGGEEEGEEKGKKGGKKGKKGKGGKVKRSNSQDSVVSEVVSIQLEMPEGVWNHSTFAHIIREIEYIYI